MFLLLCALAAPAGTVLSVPPSVPPGRVAPLPTDLLGAAINRQTQGDDAAAIRYYEAWLSGRRDGRLKAAVFVALGRLYEAQGDLNLAAAVFAKARQSGAPAAPWGAWHQARAEHLRGNNASAVAICNAYRESWPEGPHAEDCLVLMGDAYAAQGQRGAAAGAYQKWLETHPDSPMQETIRLRLTLASSRADPKGSIAQLQDLALNHQYHSTGASAEARLRELAAQGLNTSPAAGDSYLCQMALERKRCGFESDAWATYTQIQARAESSPELAAWLVEHDDDFMWGSKQYDAIAADLATRLQEKPDADLAWQRYRALSKGGRWSEAADQLIAGMKSYGGRFSTARTDLARALLLAGRYPEALPLWQTIGGKEGRWLAAYAAFRSEQFEDALQRMDAVIAAGGEEANAARYYRARTLNSLGRVPEAEAAVQGILSDDPQSWYAQLIRSGAPAPTGPLQARNGRWPVPEVQLPLITDVFLDPQEPVLGALGAIHQSSVPAQNWSALAWAPQPARSAGEVPPSQPPLLPLEVRADSYQPSFIYQPDVAWQLLDGLGKTYPELFPWAQGAADLGRAGAYDDAAPVVSRMYDAMEEALKKPSEAAKYKSIDLSIAEWRQIFHLVRDDYHAARFSWGAPKLASSEEQRLTALKAIYPTAHVDAIWRQGEKWDVDPLMVLGLMRQESVYRQWALSPVGAIGLMQIMPRTGGKVAALLKDPSYSPSDLEDPALNIRYGVYYLSKLLDRFGGAFPVAVGSYNGGPHNMSSWLRPWGENIRMDDYVEQIPYPETRNYVKKVSGYYATYVSLYGPTGAQVVVPANISTDDRTIIDF